MAVTGKFGINNATALVPLCDGWVLYNDRTTNKIQAANVIDKYLGTSYALTARPDDLAYDPSTGLLYATLDTGVSGGVSAIAVINLNTSVVSYIPLPASGWRIAAANGGRAFITLDSSYHWPDETILYVNGSAGTTLASMAVTDFNGNAIVACNSAGTTVYVGAIGGSGYPTKQYSFNTSTYAFTLQQSVLGYDTNGQEMRLSPDGNHLVFVNGGGNGGGYSIYDLDPTNITNNFSGWNTGAYPQGAAFSPDSANFATSNGSDLLVFGVTSHASSKAAWVGANGGGIDNISRTAFSTGGGFVYGLVTDFGSTTAPATIVWETFP